MIIIDKKKYWTAAESDKHDWIFIHFFSIIFTMGTLKSVSPPQQSNRSTILKVSPMVTEVTFAPLHKHNTCTVLKLLCLPVMTKNSIFLPLQCCLHRLFLATHPLTGAKLVHLFYWFPTCLGLLFPWFFFQSFCWFAGFSGSTRYWYFFLLLCINGFQDVDVSLFG